MSGCPLCLNQQTRLWFQDNKRDYYLCDCCELVHVPKQHHFSAIEEKAEYDKHQNNIDDINYRRFLSRLFLPLSAKLQPGKTGLDFGCGPGPALQKMFQEAGFDINVYDIFYYPDKPVLSMQYDFITMTEVVEHLGKPEDILNMLWRMLRPGGYLGIMTKLVRNHQAFSTWHYKNDPTHICFFSAATMEYIADKFEGTVEFVADDVVIFQKPEEE